MEMDFFLKRREYYAFIAKEKKQKENQMKFHPKFLSTIQNFKNTCKIPNFVMYIIFSQTYFICSNFSRFVVYLKIID
jgi:hypothetical protein